MVVAAPKKPQGSMTDDLERLLYLLFLTYVILIIVRAGAYFLGLLC
jgi:hypothetical protein